MLQTSYIIFFSYLLLASLSVSSCGTKPAETETRIPVDYIKAIPGPSDSVSAEKAKKGEVLIGYSDCNTCHKEDQRSVGPAFKDVAKRYPIQNAYIKYLAQKIRKGGSRSWGYAVMLPHPDLSTEDAELMIHYILSLKE